MVQFKFIQTKDPEYPRERALRWEMLHKPLGLPPGAELCAEDVKGLHLVALEKKEVIGCILFHPESNKSGKIIQLALAELHDHQGFVRKLLHYLERHLIDSGYKEIECLVGPDNIDFFERLGFHNLGKTLKSEKQEECFLLHIALHESE
jgi:N-acetylglutamate synthase-like GNAT family acetyltransferase